MAEQNNSSSTTPKNTAEKSGMSAESEFHAKFFPITAKPTTPICCVALI